MRQKNYNQERSVILFKIYSFMDYPLTSLYFFLQGGLYNRERLGSPSLSYDSSCQSLRLVGVKTEISRGQLLLLMSSKPGVMFPEMIVFFLQETVCAFGMRWCKIKIEFYPHLTMDDPSMQPKILFTQTLSLLQGPLGRMFLKQKLSVNHHKSDTIKPVVTKIEQGRHAFIWICTAIIGISKYFFHRRNQLFIIALHKSVSYYLSFIGCRNLFIACSIFAFLNFAIRLPAINERVPCVPFRVVAMQCVLVCVVVGGVGMGKVNK